MFRFSEKSLVTMGVTAGQCWLLNKWTCWPVKCGNECVTARRMRSQVVFIKREAVTDSKTTECYLQAWAWAHLAGSARRASGPAADGAGEPRALHLGSWPVSIPCTLGTTHQPKQDSHSKIPARRRQWKCQGGCSAALTNLFIVVPRIPVCDSW